MVTSLDCISKLISHSFLTDVNPPQQEYVSPPASPITSSANQATSLADLVTITITSAYTESTSDAVSLQIVKALLSLVLSNSLLVHHSSLLKTVRTVYNVFLLSQDSTNQMVAQGALTQMVNHVFARCKTTIPASAMALSLATLGTNGSSVGLANGLKSPLGDGMPSPRRSSDVHDRTSEEQSDHGNAAESDEAQAVIGTFAR
jgi:brefeldin A-inhibited guanine nucleotide-exchange protein